MKESKWKSATGFRLMRLAAGLEVSNKLLIMDGAYFKFEVPIIDAKTGLRLPRPHVEIPQPRKQTEQQDLFER
jgi:hypothetical protein